MIPPLEIQQRIDAHTLATEDQSRRTYLGASEIGERCLRRLWYDFHWCGDQQHEPRMLRLFARGHREEPVFIELLRGAGIHVRTPLEDGPEDFQFQDCEGHFAGTCDGAGAVDFEKDWFSLSFKTICKKDFLELKRRGVKEQFPKYWHQEQTYEGELGFEWCLFCAVNKDDDDLYFEWIHFDQIDFHTNLNKAEHIINATKPPERISNDPKTFTCRYCPFLRLCHENVPLTESQKHCRNCIHGKPGAAGTWVCEAGKPFGTVCFDYLSVCGRSAVD